MAIHSSMLALEIPQTKEPGGSMGSQEWDTTEQATNQMQIYIYIQGERGFPGLPMFSQHNKVFQEFYIHCFIYLSRQGRSFVHECSIAQFWLILYNSLDCLLALFMRFPKQEYWSGLPFPSTGDFPDPEIKPTSPALAGEIFTTEPQEKSAFQKVDN